MRTRVLLVLSALTAVGLLAVVTPSAYVHTVRGSWPTGTTVPMYLQLGTRTDLVLVDGARSWNDVAATAISMWDRQLGSLDFVGRIENRSRVSGDGVNDVFFADDVYGDAFGESLSITTHWYRGDKRTEADVVFNRGKSWNSYRGPWRSGLADFRRVALHAFGLALGLGQPDQSGQSVAAIMNMQLSDVDDLQDDDIQGVQALYGSPPLVLPSRQDSVDFRHAIETKYRQTGHVAPKTTFVDISATAIWNAEYIWYRVNRCDHDAATARVFAEVEGRGVQPLCGAPASITLFPSDADALAFRTGLETEYRDVLKSAAHDYLLDQEEDTLFVGSYVRLRLTALTHSEAIARVMTIFEPTPTPAPTPTPTPTPTPAPPAAGKYDGTYDFSFVYATGPNTVATQVLQRFFIVRNGIVSSNDGTVAGAITNDNFGNVRFTGPCPHGDSLPNPNLSATWTGIMNAGAGPKFGQGNYVCRTPVGTPSRNTWRAYNGS